MIPTDNPSAPIRIGVFDSGLGGISVLADLMAHFPDAHYIYYGDTANAPYGEKSPDAVSAWTLEAYRYLRAQGVQAMVIACNTATSAAVEQVRAISDIPVLGIEPAVKTAIEANDGDPIALLATPMTIAGNKLKALLIRFGHAADVLQCVPCPGLARLVEDNDFAAATAYLHETIKPQLRARADGGYWLVLGCTHYSLLYAPLQQVFGPMLRIFDGNTGLARHLASRLGVDVSTPTASAMPTVVYHFTAAAHSKTEQAQRLLCYARAGRKRPENAANA